MGELISTVFFFIMKLFSLTSLRTRRTGALFIGVPSSLAPLLAGMGHRSYVSFLRDGVGTRIRGHFNGGSRVARLNASCIHVRVSPRAS